MKEKKENRDKQQERNMKLASPSVTLAQNLSTKKKGRMKKKKENRDKHQERNMKLVSPP